MIKDLLPRQVVCIERSSKNKACHGKLKRYTPFAEYYNEPDADLRAELIKEFGENPKLILLRCEDCPLERPPSACPVYRLPEELKRRLG